MSVQVGNHVGIRGELMDGKGNKAGGIGIPIFCRIIFGKNLPEGDGLIGGIARSEEVDGMKIACEIDDERPQQSTEDCMTQRFVKR